MVPISSINLRGLQLTKMNLQFIRTRKLSVTRIELLEVQLERCISSRGLLLAGPATSALSRIAGDVVSGEEEKKKNPLQSM